VHTPKQADFQHFAKSMKNPVYIVLSSIQRYFHRRNSMRIQTCILQQGSKES